MFLTSLSPHQVITNKWGEVRKLVPQRDATLQAELKKQQSILLALEHLLWVGVHLYSPPSLYLGAQRQRII